MSFLFTLSILVGACARVLSFFVGLIFYFLLGEVPFSSFIFLFTWIFSFVGFFFVFGFWLGRGRCVN